MAHHNGYTVKVHQNVEYLCGTVIITSYMGEVIDPDGVQVFNTMHHRHKDVVVNECLEWTDSHPLQ